jgi:HmuY protein
MLKTIKKITLIAIASISMIACTKNESSVVAPLTANIVKDLAADTVLGLASNGMPYSAGKYTFYSLEKNAIVPNTDSASTKWDIAFVSSKILINGGTSGTGMGGAFVYTGLFDDLKTIPADSVFKTDNAPA